MATESLIIELDAKTRKLDAKLDSTNKRLDTLSKKTNQADNSLKKMAKSAGGVAGKIAKVATVVTALAAAVSAMVVSSAKGRREMEQMAKVANMTVGEFKSLSFAVSQYGFDAEKIADISKDLSDKLGEFSRDAAGPFEDFRNQMKLSKNQAKDLAVEFGNMSSEQVIGKMIKMMEDAGTSGAEMTQVLESMGSDLVKLLPLFSNNSKELNALRKSFDEINKSTSITAAQADQLKKVAGTYDLMTSSIGNATTAISANLAPEMDAFFNDVIKIVPVATQAIINFINSFRDPASIKKEFDIRAQIEATTDKLEKLVSVHKEAKKANDESGAATNRNSILQEKASKDLINQAAQRLVDLREQLVVVKEIAEARKTADAEILEGGKIGRVGGAGGTGTGGIPPGEGKSAELQAIEDSFLNESELLIQKYDRDKEVLDREVTDIAERNELKIQLKQQHEEALSGIRTAAVAKVLKEGEIAQRKQDKLDKINDKSKKDSAKLEENIAKGAMALAALVFADNKEVSAGIAFVNTAQGVTKALAVQDYTGAIATGLMGAGQISAILSAGKGGGSAPSVSAPARQSSSQSDFQPDTATLDINDASSTGSQTIRLEIVTDGNELTTAIGNALVIAQNEGRV